VPETGIMEAITFNTRIYSCILLRNDLDLRWRGKYNEDTDLSIRILKKGLCTCLFNAFLINKQRTNNNPKGGNRDIYNETNNRLEFAKSLKKQHPDIVKITKRFGRWHHLVDYSRFKYNQLELKEEISLQNKINEYDMVLVKVGENPI
jgi:GT2 family glycosyltransferase